ncbi:MAG TPA: polysaccharide biosynthesis tyrosine autokinase [Bryobacteraceae bacterium]|nr:polysaccharide biosynthesis tyrosine autokinase [Bryobacteraceae bacterium]
MSRLYETLKRLEEGRPGSILPAIDAGAPQPPAHPEARSIDPAPTAPRHLSPAPVSVEAPGAPSSEYRRTIRMRLDARAPLFPFDGTDVRAAEQYRMLRTNLLQHEKQPRVIAVTSGDASDGKTITSINIAAALALNASGNVLLIDADMRRGTIAPLLGVPASPGLAQVLHRTATLDEAVVRLEQAPNLHVLPGGGSSRNPAELLDSPAWKSLLRTAREQFRFTIVDTTPVAAVADFDLVQSAVDGVLLVVRPEHTRRSILDEAFSVVPKARLLGVVVNCVKDWLLWKHYGSSYYYGAPRPDAAPGVRS